MKPRKTVHAPTREDWRKWLRTHHRTESEIWLVFHKRHTSTADVAYEDAVEEALCFGWIDSLITRLDDDRYARKFTPRKPDSRWSTINRQRYARMQASGLLTDAGIQRPPTAKSGDAPQTLPSFAALSRDIERVFKTNPAAWAAFEKLAPSHRRNYLAWIATAKRPETKERRLRAAIEMLVSGQKLGLK